MIEIIISEVTNLSLPWLPPASVSGIIVVYGIGMIHSFRQRKTFVGVIKEYWKNYFLLYLFCVYLFIVLALTILSRAPGSRGDVSWRLFETFCGGLHGIKNPIENILLFIPLGFFLPLLWKIFYRGLWCITVGVLFSIAIEGVQYITKRGYTQTDDVVMNGLGTIIGYAVIYCCKQASLWRRSRKIL